MGLGKTNFILKVTAVKVIMLFEKKKNYQVFQVIYRYHSSF